MYCKSQEAFRQLASSVLRGAEEVAQKVFVSWRSDGQLDLTECQDLFMNWQITAISKTKSLFFHSFFLLSDDNNVRKILSFYLTNVIKADC